MRTWVEVDHAALRHNLEAVQKMAGKAGIMAVVKANGYGHGLNEVASTLSPGVEVFAVASLGEGIQLRGTEKKKPILLLSAALPSEYQEIGSQGFIPTISTIKEAELYAQAAPVSAPIHFKIDTGMGRLGAQPEQTFAILREIRKLPLTLHSISTHLHSADSDSNSTNGQLKTFEELLSYLREFEPKVPIHILNSAGTMLFPAHAHDLVRVGLALYGVSPVQKFQKLLKPALSWKASVTFLNELPKGHGISYGSTYRTPRATKVAVLPVGYADGYPRHLSGKGASVLIKGKRCPLLGRVTMDQIMVDVSAIKRIKVGEEAVLVGKQGKEEITATEVAAKADTIAWHLFCGITGRVAYFYKK
jgi:alanine racemase